MGYTSKRCRVVLQIVFALELENKSEFKQGISSPWIGHRAFSLGFWTAQAWETHITPRSWVLKGVYLQNLVSFSPGRVDIIKSSCKECLGILNFGETDREEHSFSEEWPFSEEISTYTDANVGGKQLYLNYRWWKNIWQESLAKGVFLKKPWLWGMFSQAQRTGKGAGRKEYSWPRAAVGEEL